MRVLVTGSGSHLARALLPRLCAHPGVEAVTGVDIAPPRFAHPKFSARALDIRDAALARSMRNHNVLIHMAFIVLRGRTAESEMRSVNLDGTQTVFRAARAAGIARLIHLSSAAVYGSGQDLAEGARLSPLPGFLYGQHKARLEQWLAHEIPESTRLRPHVILGPNAQPLLKRLLAQPFSLRLPGPPPRLQCVHEDDVADAVLLALEKEARGPFNLAADGSFSFGDEIRRRHRLHIPLPLPAVRSAFIAAWKLTGWGGEPAWLDGLTQNLTLDCARARRELGWQPRYSSTQTLALTRESLE